MNALWLDSTLSKAACASISGYQKYISPRKGFSCAHRLLHGGESCSQYVKRAIAQQGLVSGLKAARQRFLACKAASQILRAERESAEDAESQKKNQSGEWSNCSNTGVEGVCEAGAQSCECGDSLPCELPTPQCDLPSCNLPDCGHCSSGLDCGGADCGSGLDCGSPDCGSCSW